MRELIGRIACVGIPFNYDRVLKNCITITRNRRVDRPLASLGELFSPMRPRLKENVDSQPQATAMRISEEFIAPIFVR